MELLVTGVFLFVGSAIGAVPMLPLVRFRWPPARTVRANWLRIGSPCVLPADQVVFVMVHGVGDLGAAEVVSFDRDAGCAFEGDPLVGEPGSGTVVAEPDFLPGNRVVLAAYPEPDPLPGVVVDLLEVAAGGAVAEIVRPALLRMVESYQDIAQFEIQERFPA